MDSGVRAAGGDGMDGSMGVEVGDGLFQNPLNTGALALTLPSTKKRPRVLKTDGNPLGRIGVSSRSGVVNRALV